jgi:hypothetical protein
LHLPPAYHFIIKNLNILLSGTAESHTHTERSNCKLPELRRKGGKRGRKLLGKRRGWGVGEGVGDGWVRAGSV